MKRAFAILVVLLSVCSCGVLFAGSYVLKDKEQVTITEKVIYGDKSLAEQVLITSKFRWSGYLHWNMNYVPGEDVETEYWFTPDYTTNWREAESFRQGIQLQSYQAMNPGRKFVRQGMVESEEPQEPEPLERAYEELAGEEFVGEKEREVRIADYFLYYPLAVTVDLPKATEGYGYEETRMTAEEITEARRVTDAFEAFFQIPVLETETYRIHIRKEANGTIRNIGGGTSKSDRFGFGTTTVYDEEYIYFTFCPYSRGIYRDEINEWTSRTLMDLSRIPGGYGIYRVPYEMVAADNVQLVVEELCMMYSIDTGKAAMELELQKNAAGQILLFTGDETAVTLEVIEPVSGKCVQKLSFPRPKATSGFNLVEMQEDFLLYNFDLSEFVLLEWTEENCYTEQLRMTLPEESPLRYYYADDYYDMDWNGEQLAYVDYMDYADSSNGSNCHFVLAFYDATGLVYQGEYNCSLMSEAETEATGLERCLPEADRPLRVKYR